MADDTKRRSKSRLSTAAAQPPSRAVGRKLSADGNGHAVANGKSADGRRVAASDARVDGRASSTATLGRRIDLDGRTNGDGHANGDGVLSGDGDDKEERARRLKEIEDLFSR